jgi:hypothetical protein
MVDKLPTVGAIVLFLVAVLYCIRGYMRRSKSSWVLGAGALLLSLTLVSFLARSSIFMTIGLLALGILTVCFGTLLGTLPSGTD